MRVLVAVLAALVLVPAASSRGAKTDLAILVWPAAKTRPTFWTLRCNPNGGTLPDKTAGCAALAAHPEALHPTPSAIACTQIYGGPQVAIVIGRYNGHLVVSKFSRVNGCEIDRWDKLSALFPAG